MMFEIVNDYLTTRVELEEEAQTVTLYQEPAVEGEAEDIVILTLPMFDAMCMILYNNMNKETAQIELTQKELTFVK